jgi:hypothetical protein
MGFGMPRLDQASDTSTEMLGDAGNIAIMINLWVPPRIDNTVATQLLQQQYALLTSGSSA